MADVEEAVYAILKASSAVTALVGGSTSPRIYPNRTPQDAALPAVAYFRVSTRRRATHGAPATLARPRVQTTAQARTYAEAKTLAAAIRGALDGYMGTVVGAKVQAVLAEDEVDEFGVSDDIHAVRQDWFVWVNE